MSQKEQFWKYYLFSFYHKGIKCDITGLDMNIRRQGTLFGRRSGMRTTLLRKSFLWENFNQPIETVSCFFCIFAFEIPE